MVLFAHVKEAEGDYGGAGSLLPHWLYMGVVGVDLFFLISGFVMVHVASAASRGVGAAKRFAFNRAARIYPLYWAATVILIALYAGKLFLFQETTPFPNPIKTLLLLPDDHYPLLPVGWTLVHEMYFYAVFSVFILFRGMKAATFLGVWASAILVANIIGWTSTNAWTKVAFSPLTYEFIAGAIIALIIKNGIRKFTYTALATGVSIITVETLFFADSLYPDVMGTFGLRAAIFGVPFSLILYGATAIEAKNGLLAPQWLRSTGDASYALYLIHVPIFLVVGKLVSISLPDGTYDNIALVIAFLISALSAGFILHRWVEKPLLDITRRLGDKFFAAGSQTQISQEKAW